MLLVPTAIPVATPVADSIDATEGELLAQVPPVALLVNVPVSARHNDDGPDMVAGNGLIVTVANALHPATV